MSKGLPAASHSLTLCPEYTATCVPCLGQECQSQPIMQLQGDKGPAPLFFFSFFFFF